MSAPSIHATAVVVGEAGVLIRGRSGAGKSALALDLIETGARHGLFCRLVGDDRVKLTVRNKRLIARGHPHVAGRIERRGQGLAEIEYEPAAVIRLVVDLDESTQNPRFPSENELRTALSGVEIARMSLNIGQAPRVQVGAVFARLRLIAR